MRKRIEPRWKDGRIDPDWLGSAGTRFVRGWLSERLAGSDPHQPIDVRSGEDPDAFVVGLLREVGVHHPAYDVVARAALELLDEAAKAAPRVPPYFQGLLRICQQVRLPHVSTWFAEELDRLATGVGKRNKREEHWGGYEAAKEIAFAAVVQSPGGGDAASRPAWEKLIEEPRYTSIAFMALSRSFSDQVRFLGKWWSACHVDERERELEQVLASALDGEGRVNVRAILQEHAASLLPALKPAIDAALRRLGHGEIFGARRSYMAAIEGAGLRRDLVFAEQRAARKQ